MKNLAFDTLDEKNSEGIKKLALKDDGKVEKTLFLCIRKVLTYITNLEYTSSGDELGYRKKSLRKDKTFSASLGYNSDARTETQRSNSIENGSTDTVVLIHNICMIDNKIRASLTSQSSQSGPFATMKENAEKKKKSIDQEDD
uniref:Uncharacterized protein n=1 Tax=Heterorhabditis bacteriophora TaxID=37862 RepID=A0A1I7XGZ1_HETBA